MRKRVVVASSLCMLVAALLATVMLGQHTFAHPNPLAAHPMGSARAAGSVGLQDLHALFFVWASGTPAVQQAAASECVTLALSSAACAEMSAAIRAAWLDLASRDPAAVGRPDVPANLAGRAQALNALSAHLATITGGRTAEVLTATAATYMQISQPQWIAAHVENRQSLPAGTVLVWATSYTQNSLPNKLSPKRSPYAALPDAYLKYANWGQISNIPSIYQPYYAPTGGTAKWSVNIANASGSLSIANVLITDVGPWNEDDNWWDPNGTSTTPAANCPVSSSLVAPDATSNALVNGICPNVTNLRRIYYYVLYQHFGLPFFLPGGYAPTGTFADGTAWPTALPQECSEAAAASKNSDGVTCYTGGTAYNHSNGGWLRNTTYNSGITNQASIDVSPAVDKTLGWVYPSSGLVQVTVSNLP